MLLMVDPELSLVWDVKVPTARMIESKKIVASSSNQTKIVK